MLATECGPDIDWQNFASKILGVGYVILFGIQDGQAFRAIGLIDNANRISPLAAEGGYHLIWAGHRFGYKYSY